MRKKYYPIYGRSSISEEQQKALYIDSKVYLFAIGLTLLIIPIT